MLSLTQPALLAMLIGAAAPATPATPKTAAPAKPAPKPTAPPAPTKAPAPAPEVVRGPINIPALFREGRARFSCSKLAAGSWDQIFDGNRFTFARAEVPAAAAGAQPGTGFWQVTLDRPRLIDEIDVTFTTANPHSWTLFGADTEADMAARSGSFKQLTQPRTAQFEGRDQVPFPAPKGYKIYRLECRKLSGEGGPELAEWSIWTPQQLSKVTVDSFVPNVAKGEKIQIRSLATLDAGAEQNVTPEVKWEVSPPTAGAVDELARFEGLAPGSAQITAILNGKRSAPLAIEVLPEGTPDWTVSYIERQPRLHYGDGNPELKIGQTVYWFAHVRNYGTGDAEAVPVEWRLDGKTIRSGSLPKLERFQQTELILGLPWDGAGHDLELVVDPSGSAPEVSKTNNRLVVRTNAVPVGFWVEDATLQYFHRHQKELGAGSNSFEDWAQRQVAFWNRWMEGSAWLWSDRKRAAQRFRLDRIIVVGDGMLPMAGGTSRFDPDRRDDTVLISVGIPAVDSVAGKLYQRTAEKSMSNPFYYQGSLLQALGQLQRAAAKLQSEAMK